MLLLAGLAPQDSEGFWSMLEHISTTYHLLEGFIWIGGLLLAARFLYFDYRDKRRNANFRELSISINTLESEPARDGEQRFRLRMRTLFETTILRAMGESHKLATTLVRGARAMGGTRSIICFPTAELARAIASEARGEVGQLGANTRLQHAGRGESCPETTFVYGVACESALGPDHKTGEERLRIILLTKRDVETLVAAGGLELTNLRKLLVRDDEDVSRRAHDRRVQTIHELLLALTSNSSNADAQRCAVGRVKLAS